jgi:hypothetical protein
MELGKIQRKKLALAIQDSIKSPSIELNALMKLKDILSRLIASTGPVMTSGL